MTSTDEYTDVSIQIKTKARCFQYHSSITLYDAIGNSIRTLNRLLNKKGIESCMICRDDQIVHSTGGVRPLSHMTQNIWRSSDILFVHYSFYDDKLLQIMALPVRKVFVYHNVTPGHFFRRSGMDWIADAADRSLDQVSQCRGAFDAVVCDSLFNLNEMPNFGVSNKTVIPVFYEDKMFSDPLQNKDLYFELKNNNEINILFVGRFVPNKRHDKIVDTLASLKKYTSRKVNLHLAGKIWSNEYYLDILSQATSLDVVKDIRIYQGASQSTVTTLFSLADAFVSMSEHEGFMVPILEAFAAGCPVVANPTTAVGETMGPAGLKVPSGDPEIAAAMIEMLRSDRSLRLKVVAEQASRALDFRTNSTFEKWVTLLQKFENIEEIAA